jgi:preprotein translocase subunit SecD
VSPAKPPKARRAARWLASVLVASAALTAANCNKHDNDAATTTTALSGPKGAVLQLRPVTGLPNDCGALPDNPDPAQPYAVLYTNQCLALGPAVMVVNHADAKPEVDAEGRQLVDITLRGSDVQKMAEVSRTYLGKQVAVVALGKVLSVPTFQAPIEGGKVQITNIGRNDAIRLQKALA